jgi:hypothetical protein
MYYYVNNIIYPVMAGAKMYKHTRQQESQMTQTKKQNGKDVEGDKGGEGKG